MKGFTTATAQEKVTRLLAWTMVGLAASAVTTAHARGEVDFINTEAVAATPSSTTADGQTYRWGLGMDVKIRSFVFNGKTLTYNPVQPDRVQLVRIDNPNANGKPCAIYAETAGTPFSYQPTMPAGGDCPMGQILAGNTVNIGALDVFSNTSVGNYSIKNIERVDLIYSRGIVAPASGLELAGHPVLEKSGNNPVQIAAILSLDSLGQPASYGPPVTVYEAGHGDTGKIQYGITNFSSINDFLWSDNKRPNGPMVRRATLTEPLGFAFVSLRDLGIRPGQTYYGVSAFATDVDPAIHDLTNPATFPRDTGHADHGDAPDLHIGSAGNLVLKPLNRPPVAAPDSATTKSGVPVSIDAKANDSDPDNDPLTLTIVTAPAHGTATVEQGLIVYTPAAGFTGSDALVYRVADGKGGNAEAQVTITVEAENGTTPRAVLGDSAGSKRIIETGLQGHGAAGSMGWLLAPLAAAAWRRRRPASRSSAR